MAASHNLPATDLDDNLVKIGSLDIPDLEHLVWGIPPFSGNSSKRLIGLTFAVPIRPMPQVAGRATTGEIHHNGQYFDS